MYPSEQFLPDPPEFSSTATSAPHRLAAAGLALLCLFLFFWRLGCVPLFDLDEGLYAACTREMVLTSDWVTPRLNARSPLNPGATLTPFFEKPILIYWLAAGSMRSFGISPWSARLPVALASLLTTGLVFLAGRRWFGQRAGLLAGMVYATAPITVADARQLTTDSLLVLWFSASLLSYRACRHAGSGTRRGWACAALFWLCCALAVLTKGAVGLLLPLLVIGIDLLLARLALRLQWRGPGRLRAWLSLRLNPKTIWLPAVRALRPLAGLLLFVALIAPWHLLVLRAGGRDELGHTWVQEYLIRQHIGRFKGQDTVHNAPLLSYLVYFLIGFFPWACFTPAAFRARASLRDSDAVRFLKVWFWTIFLFFTMAAAKLPTYIAPAYPAAALLVGRWLDSALSSDVAASVTRSLRRGALAALITALFLVVVALFGARFAPASAPIPNDVVRFAVHLTLVMATGGGIAWLCLRRSDAAQRARQAGVAALGGMIVLMAGVGCTEGYAVAARDVLDPYQQIAAAALPDARQGVPVVFYHIVPRRPSMLFYARYSPFESKEDLLLPFLRSSVPLDGRQVDVVTSLDAYDRLLMQELASHPDIRVIMLATRGGARGWVLLRLSSSRPLTGLSGR